MCAHAADRLLAALDRAGSPACVGLDPVLERLPTALRCPEDDPPGAAGAIASFTRRVLDAVAQRVGCVKFQSACFERYGPEGVRALRELMAEAGARGLQVILDAKRGDISPSAAHYAAAAFSAPGDPDWVTVNSYLGADSIEPFLRPGHGAFALVRTSNPSSDVVQAAQLADGRTVAQLVAKLIASIGSGSIGESGYSALGAVVGATKPGDLADLRGLMPRQIFLMPGFGAQGGRVADVPAAFDEHGRGAVIAASRSVIYAFERDQPDWDRAVGDAAAAFAADVASAVGR